MNIERVGVLEDFVRAGHRLLIVGRRPPAVGRYWFTGATVDGAARWEPLTENVDFGRVVGIPLAEGMLDAICEAHLGIAAPTPATERHLLDAIATRDRLLTIIGRPS